MTSEWSLIEDPQILVATVQNSGATLTFWSRNFTFKF